MIFCKETKIKVSNKLILTLWLKSFLKVDTIIIDWHENHSQNTQNNKFTICGQYLQKEVMDGVYVFYANKHQSFYMLALSILMEVARHVYSTQNGKLVVFL